MQALSSSARSNKLVSAVQKKQNCVVKRMGTPRSVACNYRSTEHAGAPASALLDSLKSDKEFAEQLTTLKSFDFIVDMHMMMQDMVNEQAPLQLAQTAVSDERGVLLVRSPGEGPFQQATLRVQTLTGPEPIDWAHHTFGIAKQNVESVEMPGFAYSKSSVYTSNDSLLPHLELEMGTGGDGSKVLLYINMDPRLSLVSNPQYLTHYYESAPPSSGGASSSSSSSSSSWVEIESKASQSPGFTRFTSPSFHVRACSATGILFNVESTEEGRAAAKQILQEATQCWLNWLAAAGTDTVGSNPEAVAKVLGPDRVPKTQEQQQVLLEELAARSIAWRRFPRLEKMAGALVASFGAEAMDNYWDSMAGDPRIRRV